MTSFHDPTVGRHNAAALTCDSPLLQALFPFDVAARELRSRGTPDWLLPEEFVAIQTAAPARIAEFAAGRQCAREALAVFGLPVAPLLRGRHRQPLWPEGVRGSITHTEGYCAAAVAPAAACAGLGIDAERCGRVGTDLWPALFGPAEIAALRALDPAQCALLATILFAAKEAFFKSQHALTGAIPEFHEVGFGLDVPPGVQGRVVLVNVDDARLDTLQGRVQGRYAVEGTLVVAGVALAAM
ncbi:MAG: 4'-phosphopantetheinyl transferase superfamily protein [Steroidobacteraceae bacterium]